MWVLGLALATVSITGCGKKGAPLAPIVHVPAAAGKLAARRVGNDIYITLTIPAQNLDASTPADVSRIDLYGATSLTPPPLARIFEIASKVASVEVKPPPRPDQNGAAEQLPADRANLPAQGTTITLRDSLSVEELQPKELPPVGSPSSARGTPPTSAAPAPVSVLRRFYVAVATSDRGRQGPPGTILEVPLSPLPDPPPAPVLVASEDNITVTWEPSGGVLGFLFEKPTALEDAPVDDLPPAGGTPSPPAMTVAPAGPILYNVYREPPSDAASATSTPPWNAAPAAPLNPAPLAALTFTDPTPVQFDRQQCYTVRAVRGVAPNVVVSEPSPRACLTPKDSYPPAAPTGLYALAAGGVINLSWEPNGEADLGGYVVLRGRAGDATLQRLTASPLMDTRYVDRDVMPGVRYVYAIEAVDLQRPPNVSAESNRVEEAAR
jgi:hypothetical protein